MHAEVVTSSLDLDHDPGFDRDRVAAATPESVRPLCSAPPTRLGGCAEHFGATPCTDLGRVRHVLVDARSPTQEIPHSFSHQYMLNVEQLGPRQLHQLRRVEARVDPTPMPATCGADTHARSS